MRTVSLGWIAALVILTASSFAQPPDVGERRAGPTGEMRDRMLRSGRPPELSRGPNSASTGTMAGQQPTSNGMAAQDRNNVIVNLGKGVDVAQIVNFISEQTKKPVLKDNAVQGRIAVYSAGKIPPDQALQLIYDALELNNIAVIETPRAIRLVSSEAAKTMRVQILQPDESASSLTNKTQMVQKIFKLKTTTGKSVQAALQPLLGKQASMGVDERTKTVIITDTAASVERFEQLVAAMDRVEVGQIKVQIFKLQFANAEDLASLVAMMAVAGESGQLPVQQQRSSSYGEDSYYRRRFGGGIGGSSGQMAGDVVVLPDTRTNWLIVAGPPDKVLRIEQMVKEMDVPGRTDVEIRVVEVKHADAEDMALDIREMIRIKIQREKQEIFDVRSTERGNQLMIMATPQTFKLVQQMIKELDTTQSVQRETRTYELKYMDATEMADQLTQLYQDELRGSYSYIFGYYGRGSSSRNEAKFVPVVRSNSIMVLASPNDYEFIEKLIKELDVETPEENLAPRVYHITHTDASEMVTVLTELFTGQTGARTGQQPDFYMWRPQQSRRTQDGIGALYGKVRFVVYRNTNSIVAITNNPQNFQAIEGLIKQLDILDPEATNMLVVQLSFADAAELSNNLNNLLSEGAVSRTGQAQRPGQQQTQGTQQQQQQEEPPPVEVILPWQSGQRRPTTRTGLEERPISSLINRVRIVPDVRSQKLIVAAPSIYFETLKKLIEDLDKAEPQVQLETYIVRVETEKARRVGWRWMPDASTVSPEELDNAVVALGNMGFTDTFEPDVLARRTGGGIVTVQRGGANSPISYGQQLSPGRGVLNADVNVALLLQLLVKNRNASVVAHPQVTVNNNEKGTLFVGESVPFETGSVTSTEGRSAQTTVNYNDVGTRLEITPQINKQGRVVMKVFIENSRRKPELLNGRAITEMQRYETKLTVENGQKVWLGGLSEQRLDNVVRKIPLIGEIPFLGVLFRKSDKVNLETKIYAFIVPAVIETAAQADAQYQRARNEIETYQKEYPELQLILPGGNTPTSGTTTAPKAEL